MLSTRNPSTGRSPAKRPLKATLQRQAALLAALVAVFWLVEIVDQAVMGGRLDRWGVQPRSERGLTGLVLAPFLHASLAHVAANTLPFVVLGWLILLRGFREFFRVTLLAVFFSGLTVWLIGRSSTVHIGASSLIFGYLGYLILRGYFDRSAFSVLISVLVGIFYGSLIWGVLPTASEASWEGHLGGFVAGVGCAWLFTRRPRKILEIRI